jgi:hypothetical protein
MHKQALLPEALIAAGAAGMWGDSKVMSPEGVNTLRSFRNVTNRAPTNSGDAARYLWDYSNLGHQAMNTKIFGTTPEPYIQFGRKHLLKEKFPWDANAQQHYLSFKSSPWEAYLQRIGEFNPRQAGNDFAKALGEQRRLRNLGPLPQDLVGQISDAHATYRGQEGVDPSDLAAFDQWTQKTNPELWKRKRAYDAAIGLITNSSAAKGYAMWANAATHIPQALKVLSALALLGGGGLAIHRHLKKRKEREKSAAFMLGVTVGRGSHE